MSLKTLLEKAAAKKTNKSIFSEFSIDTYSSLFAIVYEFVFKDFVIEYCRLHMINTFITLVFIYSCLIYDPSFWRLTFKDKFFS